MNTKVFIVDYTSKRQSIETIHQSEIDVLRVLLTSLFEEIKLLGDLS